MVGAQKRAYVLADNQLAITGSGWNPRKNFFLSVNHLTLLDRFLNDAA